jgi:hypothetical protein
MKVEDCESIFIWRVGRWKNWDEGKEDGNGDFQVQSENIV